MNWLEFIEKIIGHLVWPTFALLVLLLLRDEVRNHFIEILHAIKTVKLPGLEVAFQELRVEAAATGITLPADPPKMADIELAKSSPSTIIFQDWKEIETKLLKLLDKHEIPHVGTVTTSSFHPVRNLYRTGAIDPEAITIVYHLRRIRNEVAQTPGRALTEGEALEYHQMARAVLNKLEEKAENISQSGSS